MLGLPDGVTAGLFDLDGVLTDTASLHDRAWAATFDAYLEEHADRGGRRFAPFDPQADYDLYIDGRSRADGVRTFLRSRGILLAEGAPDDPPDAETVHGLGNRKNALLLSLIERTGVRVYEGSRRYLEAARGAGLRRVVVSSSANTASVLRAGGLAGLVEAWIDGVAIARGPLRGKPAPDAFLAGARLAGVPPREAAVFEDAISGVEAGRAGEFGFVVGVNRLGARHAADLCEHGADVVVRDLGDLLGGGLAP